MNIAAFDLSLQQTGWARHVAGTIDYGVIKPAPKMVKTPIERLEYIRRNVFKAALDAELVVIEDYAFSRSNRAHQMGELGGVIRHSLAKAVKLVAVSPTTLKKFATGKGNASKELMLVDAVVRLGYKGSNHNEADSLWLLYAAMAHYEVDGFVAMPKRNRQALEKVNWEGLC